MELLKEQPSFQLWPDGWPAPLVFTDDYSNVFQLIRLDFAN